MIEETRLRRTAPSMLNHWKVVGALASLALGACAAPERAALPETREWTGVLRMAGAAVGTVREQTAVRPDGAIATRLITHFTIDRAGAKLEFDVAVASEENAAGDLRRTSADMRYSEQTQRVEAVVEGQKVQVRSWSGGPGAAPQIRMVPVTGRLIGPEALRRRTAAELRRVGDSLEASTFVAELGGVYSLRRVLREVTTSGGRPVRVVDERWKGVPVQRTLRIDGDGQLIEQRDNGPFGEMIVARADPAALKGATGALPAGLYESTLVRSNVRLPSPREADFLRLRVTLRDDSLGWPTFDGDGQRVVERSGKSAIVEIQRREIDGADGASGQPAPEFLAPNAIIESADPEVVRLAREITAGESDPTRKALLLTEWVHRNMKFDLGIMMAPASEIARQRRGTCAGYATLLAALARASGIPSRYVFGLVYVLGIWGGHAWAEMWVDGRWVPFDAAVYSPAPADAGHLAFARDSLHTGVGGISLAGVQVYGRVDIDIVAMRVAGKDLPVPAAPAMDLRGDTWESAGLGLAVRAPDGFRFAVTNAVWPDSTLVALEGPGGVQVRLREENRYPERDEADAARARLGARGLDGAVATRAAGEPAYRAAGERRAGVAWVAGSQVFTLVAEGADAGRVLDGVLERVALRRAPATEVGRRR
jgi:transglutaminase-like putative cysteine protease